MQTSKYGRVTTEHKEIPEDEPVFIIRGQDRFAVPVLDYYLAQLATANAPESFQQDVADQADRIQAFQEANPSRVKNPD